MSSAGSGVSVKKEPPRKERLEHTTPSRRGWNRGGVGLVSTAHDDLRLSRTMLTGGTLDGVRILSPKTVSLVSLNFARWPGHRSTTRNPCGGGEVVSSRCKMVWPK